MIRGLLGPRTGRTPLSHLRKIEVRLRLPPSVEGASTDLHINIPVLLSRNQVELEARATTYQGPRNCDQWMPRLAMLHAPLMGRLGGLLVLSPPTPLLHWSQCHPFLGLCPSTSPPSLAGSMEEGGGSKDPPLFPRTLRSSSLSPSGWSGYQSMPHSWRSQVDQPGGVPVGSQPAPVQEHTGRAVPSTSRTSLDKCWPVPSHPGTQIYDPCLSMSRVSWAYRGLCLEDMNTMWPTCVQVPSEERLDGILWLRRASFQA